MAESGVSFLLFFGVLFAATWSCAAAASVLQIRDAQELADAVGEFGASGRDPLSLQLVDNITITDATRIADLSGDAFGGGQLSIEGPPQGELTNTHSASEQLQPIFSCWNLWPWACDAFAHASWHNSDPCVRFCVPDGLITCTVGHPSHSVLT